MGVRFTIKYHEKVVTDDIQKLSTIDQRRIKSVIEQKLSNEPEVFGVPLRKSLKGYRKLRVGDYRVIFRIENTTVKIFVIGHRSIVYKNSEKRLV